MPVMAEVGRRSDASTVDERHSAVGLENVMREHADPGFRYWSGLNCQAVTGTELVILYAPLSTRADAVRRPTEVFARENSGPFRPMTHLRRMVCSSPGLI